MSVKGELKRYEFSLHPEDFVDLSDHLIDFSVYEGMLSQDKETTRYFFLKDGAFVCIRQHGKAQTRGTLDVVTLSGTATPSYIQNLVDYINAEHIGTYSREAGDQAPDLVDIVKRNREGRALEAQLTPYQRALVDGIQMPFTGCIDYTGEADRIRPEEAKPKSRWNLLRRK